jgi:hypothetical protein
MDEVNLNIRVRLGLDGTGRLQLLSSSVTGERDAAEREQPIGELPVDIERMVSVNAPKANATLYRDYLRRCVHELAVQLAPPATGNRPYVNLVPPPPHRRKRLAAVNLRSGRVHCNIDPAMVDRWSKAEVVFNSGVPVYLRIYLRSAACVDQAVDMTRVALELREA